MKISQLQINNAEHRYLHKNTKLFTRIYVYAIIDYLHAFLFSRAILLVQITIVLIK